jgi:hypothetical protein
VILDSYFAVPLAEPTFGSELPLLRPFHEALDPSATAAALRHTWIPAFFAITGPFVPDELRALFD